VIQNLVVNGCSFTDDRNKNTWATILAKQYPNLNYHNLASVAAGNDYIANSTIEFLEKNNFDPAETLVLIMWSGTGRKDLKVSGEWWYHLNKEYPHGSKLNDEYYLFSGGLTNSWTTNNTVKKIFNWLYKLSDPTTLCRSSVMNFINLENYLRVQGYQYKFTSYVNYWDPLTESNFNSGDYSIGHFAKDYSLFQKYNFSNWFFVNNQRDCLAEFALGINELDTTGHPTVVGHEKFAKQIVNPAVKELLV
jgi:hypothetical protein